MKNKKKMFRTKSKKVSGKTRYKMEQHNLEIDWKRRWDAEQNKET